MQNEEQGDFGVLLVIEGVHFVNNGTLYMTAVPEGWVFISCRMEDQDIFTYIIDQPSIIQVAISIRRLTAHAAFKQLDESSKRGTARAIEPPAGRIGENVN